MSKNEKRFKKALVIFIDILGSQSRTEFSELLKINELFHSELLGNKEQDREYLAYQRHIYTFSDCAYIIYDYRTKSNPNWGALFDVALLNCEPILMRFLSEKLVFRGGIAYGNAYYDENRNVFFGDAVIRAYQYESKVAKYPRIVLDKYVAEAVIAYTKEVDRRAELRDSDGSLSFDDHIGCMVKLDSDSSYYLNYFNSIQHGRDYSRITKKSNKQFLEDIISMCDNQIAIYRENKNVSSKYEWLKSYAEQSINEQVLNAVEYKKPFWDKVLDRMLPVDICLLKEHLMLPNVGISFSDAEQRELFKKFSKPEIFDALWKLGD